MTPIEMLTQRISTALLCEPAPDITELDQILSAGMKVPDHGNLQPWHFTVVTNKGLQRLSDVFVKAVCNNIDQTLSKTSLSINAEQQARLTKTAKMPFRAPLIIIVSTKFIEHKKVPKQEQLITAGCCVHAMQMAAFSLGYGAIWRTGDLAYNSDVKQSLELDANDEIVGFLYVGSPVKEQNNKLGITFKNKVTYWK